MGVSSMVMAGAQDTTGEYQLKAALLARFPRFVQWPDTALNASTALSVCVVRPNPFGKILAQLLAGETAQGHSISWREIGGSDDIDRCHVLFISAQSARDERTLLARAGNVPVLTVGETQTFLDHDGIIALRVDDRRVRFDVNIAAANRAGLRLSSQLLRLAVRVRGGAQ
jgi:hypothetical protein